VDQSFVLEHVCLHVIGLNNDAYGLKFVTVIDIMQDLKLENPVDLPVVAELCDKK